MRLPALLVSDLHLTANPRDEYRWSLFPWMVEVCDYHRVKTILVLGDVTDAKDYHPAELVNRVSNGFSMLRKNSRESTVEKIYIIMGNHDYLKTGVPFFNFLGNFPHIEFITKPTFRVSEYSSVALLPHTKTPMKDWRGLDFRNIDLVFMHQTVSGSIASNGMELEGELDNQIKGSLKGLPANATIYSGDIHKPQCIGDVTYVGSPYPVHFGDTEIIPYRSLILDEDMAPTSIYLPSIHRISVRGSLAEIKGWKLRKGDQVKIKLRLLSSERDRWETLRREVLEFFKEQGVEVLSIELSSTSRRRALVKREGSKFEGSSAESLILQHVESEDVGSFIYELAMEVVSCS